MSIAAPPGKVYLFSYATSPAGGERMSTTAANSEDAIRFLEKSYPFTLDPRLLQVMGPKGWLWADKVRGRDSK